MFTMKAGLDVVIFLSQSAQVLWWELFGSLSVTVDLCCGLLIFFWTRFRLPSWLLTICWLSTHSNWPLSSWTLNFPLSRMYLMVACFGVENSLLTISTISPTKWSLLLNLDVEGWISSEIGCLRIWSTTAWDTFWNSSSVIFPISTIPKRCFSSSWLN